ncbi:MAG: hypothetical protein GY711_23015 [bacterium]|nr:hypothetical protein [bacterium]
MPRSLLLACLLLCGCNHTALFQDNFNTEVLGTTPSSMPPGDPPDDELAITGDAGMVTVADSGQLDSYAMRIERDEQALAVDCIPQGGPHGSGNFVVRFVAVSENENAAGITVRALSSSDAPLLAFSLIGGAIKVQGFGAFPIGYVANQEHAVLLGIDLDAGTYTLLVGNGEDSDSIDSVPLLPGGDFAKLRFSYPATIVEALPGVYWVDDIVISRAND